MPHFSGNIVTANLRQKKDWRYTLVNYKRPWKKPFCLRSFVTTPFSDCISYQGYIMGRKKNRGSWGSSTFSCRRDCSKSEGRSGTIQTGVKWLQEMSYRWYSTVILEIQLHKVHKNDHQLKVCNQILTWFLSKLQFEKKLFDQFLWMYPLKEYFRFLS